ncbi:RNA methyltransferase [Kaistia dalseonensis]|uniref:TrmH family RNA methyltransferase n=1 Tax=Kaistia dalseonensis TaxID=410840 RepID=A0ABU0HBQ1_9HYPH|nr:RNA methyltransferase [Kaistia dalseonensis]MCX5496322.1 RNA methyltransferase [Kaistia dalseonensis]MDQ0438941.1 TrmH family RNA methyltransferase [Kaistia dalseonensis]
MADNSPIAAPGAVKTITSLTNPTIKDIRGLALPKNRKESGLFVTEGMKLVADAVEEDWPIKILVYGAKVAQHPVVRRVAQVAHARGGDVLEVSEAVLEKITRRDNPQMVVGVFEQRLTPKAEIRPSASGVWIALEGIKDPGNLGTIIRTADAVGAEGVILVGDTVDPFGVEAVRATMGSIFHMKLTRMSVDEFVAWRKSWPGIVVGTHLSGKEDYRAVDYDKPVLLFMGNEQSGLPDALAATCDHLVKIPQVGRADSLNLAIATGVMLFEIRRDKLKLG